MRAVPGTYALLLSTEEEQTVEVGALGDMTVRPGTYVYVGSAFGPGGLRARIGRHVRNEGTVHWHVDYVRAATTLKAIWYTPDSERRECAWAGIVRSLPETTVPLDGFGASDCNCPAHLVRFELTPSLSTFRTRVHAQCPDHAVIKRIGKKVLG